MRRRILPLPPMADSRMHTTRSTTQPAAIAFPHEAWPGPGEAVAVASGVYWLRMPLPFVLNHINLWLLADGDGWTIVDSGVDTAQIRDLWQLLHAGAMGGRPVRRLIVTHFHPDHFGLAAWLVEHFGCELWMTAPEFRMAEHAIADDSFDTDGSRLAFFRHHGLRGERLKALQSWGGTYRRAISGLPAGFRPLQDGAALAIGGRDWRVITGQGHSPDHATLHCPELDLLISGDHILPSITPHIGVWHFEPDADPIRLYLASLERFAGLPATTLVLPAHGLPFTGLQPRLEALARHHAERFELLLSSCAEPRTAADVLASMFRRRLNPHQLYFAMSEAIAHLNYLLCGGQLVRERDQGGTLRFHRP